MTRSETRSELEAENRALRALLEAIAGAADVPLPADWYADAEAYRRALIVMGTSVAWAARQGLGRPREAAGLARMLRARRAQVLTYAQDAS